MARLKRTISLPREHDRILEELANDQFEGNISAAIRRLMESHPVTKSRFALANKATDKR